MKRFPLPSWGTVLAGLIVAGAIHIAVVLGVPQLATNNAWTRLHGIGKEHEIKLLPVAAPDAQTLPMMSPDIRYAICRYDLTKAPLRVSTPLPDGTWTIAFYTPLGDNFYTIRGSDIRRDQVQVVVYGQNQEIIEPPDDAQAIPENEIVVRAQEAKGLIVIHAPIRSRVFADLTDEQLRKARCAPLTSDPTGWRQEAGLTGSDRAAGRR